MNAKTVALKTVKITWMIIKGIFLTYAVLFAIASTTLLIIAARYVSKPILEVQALKKHNPTATLYMQQFSDSLGEDSILHTFVPLDSISPTLIQAVLAVEDDGFWVHPGFDISAIASAYEYNVSQNRLKRGASTLTQQMAKNLFTGGKKNFERKYIELAYTILMEMILGKNRILELYMNYAQWGKNIFGCEAASQFYFNKPCKNLTIDQASRLAAVLAKPSTLNPNHTKSILLKKRLRVIGDNLYRRHTIDDSTYMKLTESDSLITVIKTQKMEDSLKKISPEVQSTDIEIINRREF